MRWTPTRVPNRVGLGRGTGAPMRVTLHVGSLPPRPTLSLTPARLELALLAAAALDAFAEDTVNVAS